MDKITSKQKRIIVFGGVFDPVHKGHISVALAALSHCHADKLLFLPERRPYRKNDCSDYSHRLAMLQLAIQAYPQLAVLDYPEDKQMIEPTFRWLQTMYPDHALVWLMGSDVVSMLVEWPDAKRLKEFGVEKLVVATRGTEAISQDITQAADSIGVSISEIPAPDARLSSSQIRAQTTESKDVLIPAVYDYICAEKLYS